MKSEQRDDASTPGLPPPGQPASDQLAGSTIEGGQRGAHVAGQVGAEMRGQGDGQVCLPGVLAASTELSLVAAGERPELSLFPTHPHGCGCGPTLCPDDHPGPPSSNHAEHRCVRRSAAHSVSPSLRLTPRDRQVLLLVWQCRALRVDQIQLAAFTAGGRSRCQRRLTLLSRNQYLDRLPRRAVNDPAVYVLSRRSPAGNRVVRALVGEVEFRRHRGRLGPLDHLLAINDVRVRILRACQTLGLTLVSWQRSEELATRLQRVQLIPDAYLTIQRVVAGQTRTSAFFLEVERVPKSSAVIRSKLRRYGELVTSGLYQQLFQTRSLRVLIVFAESEGAASPQRITRAIDEARRLGVTIARFADLGQFKQLSPEACLVGNIWQVGDKDTAQPLFSGDRHGQEQTAQT